MGLWRFGARAVNDHHQHPNVRSYIYLSLFKDARSSHHLHEKAFDEITEAPISQALLTSWTESIA